MEEGTKENPYTTHFLHRKLMDKDKLPFYVTETLSGEPFLRRMLNKNPKVLGKTLNHIPSNRWRKIKSIDKDYIHFSNGRINRDEKSLENYELVEKRPRCLGEYPSFSEVEEVGQYKDWEGGAYCLIPLYLFEGIYYAPIECSNTMNSEYTNQCNLLRGDYE